MGEVFQLVQHLGTGFLLALKPAKGVLEDDLPVDEMVQDLCFELLPVARQQKLLAPRIPQREGEHTVEVVKEVWTVFLIQVDYRLGVGMIRTEAVAARHQALVTIDKLGYTKHNFDLIKKFVKKPEGLSVNPI